MRTKGLAVAWACTGAVALLLLAATIYLAVRAGGVPPWRAGQARPAPGPLGARQLAVVSDRDGPLDLYVMDARPGGTVARLTQTDEWEGPPAWSPDGQWLAFPRGVEAPALTSIPSPEALSWPQAATLCVVRADGTGERCLADLGGWVLGLAWSPDGSRIAVHLVEDQNRNGRLDGASGDRSALWVVDVASGARDMVAGGVATWSGFAWAAGGTQLVYTGAAAGIPRLYAVRLDDGSRIRLADIAGLPAVSPDGQQVAYATFRRAAGDWRATLYVAGVDGRAAMPLPGGQLEVQGLRDLAWSPDGRNLLFVTRDEGGAPGLFLLPLEADAPRRLAPDLEGVPVGPAWSPDGGAVAFSLLGRTAGGGEEALTFPARLYLLDVVSGEATLLTPDAHNYLGATWRPGG
ncbi:MAG: PD40 domain-containing protein [Anaerolineae bacterium]|nr:PD40 domain-containing protein [Anaerolineae bacterium]